MIEQFHPEFGYFQPTAHVRREWRVGLAAFLGGTAIGAVAMVAVSVSYREADKAAAPEVATERAVAVTAWKESPPSPRKTAITPVRNSNGEVSASKQSSISVEPAPHTPRADAESYPSSAPSRENIVQRVTTEPDLMPKPRPIRGPESLARKEEESLPKEAGSAYARTNAHRRTVFWDWSR